MALILHLSDLHLSDLTEKQVVGDYKVTGLIPLAEQQNRLALLRSSLQALEQWLRQEGRSLDAIVVSGDVSLTYDEAGFVALEETLNHLGTMAVEPRRTLVIPGNHDVAWSTDPSSPERYEHFVTHVRGRGYVTPLLEGVDIDPASGAALGAAVEEPWVLSADGSFVLVGMNSTNYCGSRRALSTSADAALTDAIASLTPGDLTAAAELERLLAHDIARVAPGQLLALRNRLSTLPAPRAGGPIRLLALHHQLLPVSTDEELKTFESLTNLGQVRAFLVAQGVNVVLHGHKHQAACYVDRSVVDLLEPSPFGGEYLVSSAATVWRSTAAPEFARLVEVDATYPHRRTVEIMAIPSTPGGSELAAVRPVTTWPVRLPDDRDPAPIFRGSTVDEVYDQLVGFFDDHDGNDPVDGVVCTIEDGRTAARLPLSYPPIPGVDDPQTWLEEIVGWWQRTDPDLTGRGRRFNHGERIHNYADRRDQVAEVVQMLSGSTGTTRALIQLIDPVRDDLTEPTRQVPSFVLCHFLVQEATATLDCVAYFRKQQMRMWWPVNVAEIAKLQSEVARLVSDTGDQLTPGAITTFAARGVDGTGTPRVAVPHLDRLAHDDPSALWALVFDLFFGDLDAARPKLLKLFEDWRPTDMDPDGSAIALGGLELLHQATNLFAERANSAVGARLTLVLEDLFERNQVFAEAEETLTDPGQRRMSFDRWARNVERQTTAVTDLIDALEGERTPP